jgi:hypothetical protein
MLFNGSRQEIEVICWVPVLLHGRLFISSFYHIYFPPPQKLIESKKREDISGKTYETTVFNLLIFGKFDLSMGWKPSFPKRGTPPFTISLMRQMMNVLVRNDTSCAPPKSLFPFKAHKSLGYCQTLDTMVAVQLYRELVSAIHGSQLCKGVSYTGIWIQLYKGIGFSTSIYAVCKHCRQRRNQSISFFLFTNTHCSTVSDRC